jgi:TRAP-type C4-dicarboxylate transport system permease small subunit
MQDQDDTAGEAAEAGRQPLLPAPLDRIFATVHRVFEIAVIVLFCAIVVAAVLQVTNRFVVGRSLSWSEEFQRYGHIWLIFFAVPIGYRRAAHIGVDFIQKALGERRAMVLDWIIDLAWMALGAAIVVSTWILLGVAWRQVSPGIGITMDKVYLGLVIGGCYLAFTAIERLLRKAIGVSRP